MYCQRLKPADTFHFVTKGRGGKNKVPQCDDCYQARKTLRKAKSDLKRSSKKTQHPTNLHIEPLLSEVKNETNVGLFD